MQILTDETLASDYGWSDTARQIFRSKYLRRAGVPGGSGGEEHIDQALQRLAYAWALWGTEGGYFSEAESVDFEVQILEDLRCRRAFPNSPQWFNTGLWEAYEIESGDGGFALDGQPADAHHAQVHACFIQSVEDNLCGDRGIQSLTTRQARVFKLGSGTGSLLSTLRGKGEPLKGGGESSGMCSFVAGFDASAGAIKSGGTTRRSASMVVCDLDHLDVLDLIRYKARGEDEALAMAIGACVLREAGQAPYLPEISLGWNAEESAYAYAQGQNANFSVRLHGADFFALCDADAHFTLRGRASAITTTIPARQLRDEIAQAAWYSADPGIQFDDLIQAMHTSPSMGRINASNPCVTGDTLVLTTQGERRIDSLLDSPFDVIGADGRAHRVAPAFRTGHKEVLLLTLGSGKTLKLTADHLVAAPRQYDGCAITCWEDMIEDRPAGELLPGDTVVAIVPGERVFYRDTPWVWVSDTVVNVEPAGVEDVYDLTEPVTSHFVANGILVHNCSEYLFADDTACNLASIRLSAFLRKDGTLDERGLAECARRWTRILDISVSGARYPTELIAERTRLSRTIGLGPMDLGGALIRAGLRYDEDSGRRFAARCMAILHGAAGYESQVLADNLGPCDAWGENQAAFERVWGIHTAAGAIRFGAGPVGTHAPRGIPYWPDPEGPFRNAQWTVCAPTGTIGLASGSCTTGIEPLYARSVVKTLADGGSITLDADCVQAAPDERAVVTCAQLSWLSHLKMVAALQPFVSGGISKTLNLPAATTPDEIALIYRKAWELGVKCVSVYRDGSKHSQVLGGGDPDDKVRAIVADVRKPTRTKPPGLQSALRWTARIGHEAVYLTLAGQDPKAPTQLRLDHGSAGSREASSAEAISKLASLALQYGVPLEAIAETLIDVAGGAAGFVQGGSGAVRTAGSVAAWAGREILAHLGAAPTVEADTVAPAASDACPLCGGAVRSAGTCKVCSQCGHSLGGCG